uniref:CARMIL_C domain-containing protein n=1 Tax=Mesocestoides corti TaxID=53468 RepID=A0A5K3F461_MESCO
MSDNLDMLDPDDYIFGVVHLPPGRSAESLLGPSMEPVLRWFFKKLSKQPSKPLRRRLPSVNGEEDPTADGLELTSEGASSQGRLPFVGPYSKGGYCLRQFNTYRLQIRPTKKVGEVPQSDDVSPTSQGDTVEMRVPTKKRHRHGAATDAALSSSDVDSGPISSHKKSRKLEKPEQA